MYDIVPLLPLFASPRASTSDVDPESTTLTSASTPSRSVRACAVVKFLVVVFFVAAAAANLYCMRQFRQGFENAMQTIAEARRFISVIRGFMCTREHILTPAECAHF